MATVGYCLRCGAIGIPKKERQGSSQLELVLWLLFIIPGLIYTLRRFYLRKTIICPLCKQVDCMIPFQHPVAQEAWRNQ